MIIIFTHGVRCRPYFVFRDSMLVVCVTDRRTDTTYENNDHLFGRGLVGQKVAEEESETLRDQTFNAKKSSNLGL